MASLASRTNDDMRVESTALRSEVSELQKSLQHQMDLANSRAALLASVQNEFQVYKVW